MLECLRKKKLFTIDNLDFLNLTNCNLRAPHLEALGQALTLSSIKALQLAGIAYPNPFQPLFASLNPSFSHSLRYPLPPSPYSFEAVTLPHLIPLNPIAFLSFSMLSFNPKITQPLTLSLIGNPFGDTGMQHIASYIKVPFSSLNCNNSFSFLCELEKYFNHRAQHWR